MATATRPVTARIYPFRTDSGSCMTTTVIRHLSVIAADRAEASRLIEARGPGWQCHALRYVGPVDGAEDLFEYVATVETPEQRTHGAAA